MTLPEKIIPILIFIVVMVLVIRMSRKYDRWMKAQDVSKLYSDMSDKYLELIEDSFVSDQKLAEWLPIFEEVDRDCVRYCPDKNFVPIAPRLRRVIDKKESIQE